MPPDMKIVLKFEELLNHHFREEHNHEFYAAAVGMTVKGLDKLLRAYLGMTSYELIQERIHQEAINLLLHTTLKIKEITYELGISNPSWFCKCFKQKTGLRPRDYRDKVKQEINGIK